MNKRYQWRERAANQDWMDCDKAWYDHASASYELDTRITEHEEDRTVINPHKKVCRHLMATLINFGATAIVNEVFGVAVTVLVAIVTPFIVLAATAEPGKQWWE